MNRLFAASLIFVVGLAFAHAQTAPEPGAPTASPQSGAPSEAQPGQTAPQLSGKEVRANCRANAVAQGLKGPARKAAVEDCFANARPDLAKRNTCRAQGKAQGLTDKPLRQFVKQCVTGG